MSDHYLVCLDYGKYSLNYLHRVKLRHLNSNAMKYSDSSYSALMVLIQIKETHQNYMKLQRPQKNSTWLGSTYGEYGLSVILSFRDNFSIMEF